MMDSRLDQIIGEAFSKSACVVLGARLTSQVSTDSGRPQQQCTRNKWFNLDIPELECVATEVAPWRRGNIQGPLIMQVILEPRRGGGLGRQPSGDHPDGMLLEEWVIDFQPKSPCDEADDQRASGGMFARRQVAYQDTHTIYKRLVIFHRSLYSYVRVLPAFRIHKSLKQRQSSVPYDIVSRIVPAKSMAEDKQTSSFRFSAVETPKGSFQASVTYCINNPVPELEQQLQQTYASPQRIIPNYIVSPPTAAAEGPPGSFPPNNGVSAPAAPRGRTIARSHSLPHEREAQPLPGTAARASDINTGMPILELVSRSSTEAVQRQPWASNPVQVTSPKWTVASGRGPLGSTAQPSLLPKDTPWSQHETGPSQKANPLLSCPSPRSPFSQPASLPSSAATPGSSLASGPASSSLPKAASSATGKPPHGASKRAPQQPLVPAGLQEGFNLTGAILLPGSDAASTSGPRQAGTGIKLAQGGITAAAEAGHMSPQHNLSTLASASPTKDGRRASYSVESSSSCGARPGGNVGQRLSFDLHDSPPALPHPAVGSLSAAMRARSSPMCIPGTAAMPRNSSSSQLGGRKAWRAGGGRDADGEEWSPEEYGHGGSARPQRPVLSAPADSQHWMHCPASAAGQRSPQEQPGGSEAHPTMAAVAAAGAPQRAQDLTADLLPSGSDPKGIDAPAAATGNLQEAALPGLEQEPGTSYESAASLVGASPSGMSCSPQLPFAFTPSSLSCSLLHKTGAALMEAHTLGRHACAAADGGTPAQHGYSRLMSMPGASGGHNNSNNSGGGCNAGAVSGRDVSDLALIRRSAWSSRSFSNEAGQLPWLGSFSPGTNLLDNALQGSSFSGGPAMQIFQTLSGGLSPSPPNLMSGGSGGSHSAIKYEGEDDEDEGLPFALEDYGEDGFLPMTPQPACQELALATPVHYAATSGGVLSASASTDAAVGALARMLQEAPPHLRSAGGHAPLGPDLGAVLDDLETLRQQLECWTEPLTP